MSIAYKKLNFGDNISVISPSSPTPRTVIEDSLLELTNL